MEFEFFVIATNEAGSGPSERILDTVPTVPICESVIKIFGRRLFMREFTFLEHLRQCVFVTL